MVFSLNTSAQIGLVVRFETNKLALLDLIRGQIIFKASMKASFYSGLLFNFG